ncbi:hypothetical protein CD928_17640 [Sphingopyxis sp. GW247-27LB]|nr:hypothetical protein CD928_17640 [Sphingopyxis sp. GW247-27LB]
MNSFDLSGAVRPSDLERMMRQSDAQAAGIDAVAAELHRWAAEPFDLALANCGLSVLAYVARVKGRLVPMWLRAFGRIGAGRLMRSDALFQTVADRALAEMGCARTLAPRRGDVALVRLPGSGLTACICSRSASSRMPAMWAARGDRAAVIAAGELVQAWRVACRKR